ncbi:MAG: Rpn family recombination-promoting nuclease/putative transposase [SAR324 cluster bacterium]|nr:Rpn family recombination-promoting nuclease/putative transposase [SAR324 cluster bacterium]
MHFINPKTDFAFKRIFGGEHSKDILISFLNALLYQDQPVIADLEILNPWQAPQIRGIKDTYLDIKARTASGDTVIIEMQVLNVEGFEKRILYNAAKAYSFQLATGEDYSLINPVIALTITDFVLFPEFPGLLSRFILKEKEFLLDYPIHDLELVFVELPKFDKALDSLTHAWEKWLYFLKHARTLDSIPQALRDPGELQKAFEIANESNLSREELDELEKREMFIHDQRNAIRKALNQGRLEGKEEGLREGKEEGFREGEEKGIRTGLIRQIHFSQKLLRLPLTTETVLQKRSTRELTELSKKLEQELLDSGNSGQ